MTQLTVYREVASWSIQSPRLCLILVLVASSLMVWGMARLEIREDAAAIYPENSSEIIQTKSDRLLFGDGDTIILLLQPRPQLHGEEGTEPIDLDYLRHLQADLEALPESRPQGVLSVVNVIDGRLGQNTGRIRVILKEPPETGLDVWQQKLSDIGVIEGLFLARNGQVAVFYVESANAVGPGEFLTAVEALVATRAGDPVSFHLTGPIVAQSKLVDQILIDLMWLIPMMMCLVALTLFLCFGSVACVLLLLAEIGVVLSWTFGAMGWAGVPITLMTTILPILVMTMAVADGIHLLERLQKVLGDTHEASGDEVAAAMRRTIENLGAPVVITSVTTAIAFLSFLSADVQALRDFGLFAAIGVMLAMLLSFSLMPALVVMLPARWLVRTRMLRIAATNTVPTAKRPLHGFWVVAAVVAFAASGVGISRLGIQDAWVDNFASDSRIVRDHQFFNEVFWGSYRLDLVLQGDTGYFEHTKGIQLVEDLEQLVLQGPHIAGVSSFLILYSEVAKRFQHDEPVSSASTGRLNTIISFSRSYADSTGFHAFLTPDGSTARVRISVKSPDYEKSLETTRFLEQTIEPFISTYPVKYHISGDLPVAQAAVGSIVRNQLRSIFWTFCAIALVLMLVYRRFAIVGLVMLPAIAAVWLTLGLMGFIGVELGIASSMFAALIIGVGVDYGVHYVHSYRVARATSPDVAAAIETAHGLVASALQWNTIVLVSGFGILVLSGMKPNHLLGLLLACALCLSYFVAMIAIPRLLRVAAADLK